MASGDVVLQYTSGTVSEQERNQSGLTSSVSTDYKLRMGCDQGSITVENPYNNEFFPGVFQGNKTYTVKFIEN